MAATDTPGPVEEKPWPTHSQGGPRSSPVPVAASGDEVAAAYPLGRLGIPRDIGSVVAFLLSGDAAWMTGQTLVVDGGVTPAGGA